MINSWLIWATGGLGIVGMIALAIFAPPVFTLVSSVAEKLLGPIATSVGNAAGSLIAAEESGAVDIMATGKRMLVVATFGMLCWYGAAHMTWNKVHRNFWLTQKHYAIVRPHAVRGPR